MGYQDTMSCGNILSTLEQDINTYKVFNAYPNPFNPNTTLSYYMPNSAQVSIIIYDIHGRVINNFFNGFQESGHRSITWYAKNDLGRPVSAGIYFLTIKLVILRIQKNGPFKIDRIIGDEANKTKIDHFTVNSVRFFPFELCKEPINFENEMVQRDNKYYLKDRMNHTLGLSTHHIAIIP